MRLLVTGGRAYTDREQLFAVLDRIHARRAITLLIHGACPQGADELARQWAIARGVPETGATYAANWNSYLGHRAGFARNQRMLDQARPDVCVAFPGSGGTADMVRRARDAGLKILAISPRSRSRAD